MKHCPKCNKDLEESLFKKKANGSYQAYCIECKRIIDREYQARKRLEKKVERQRKIDAMVLPAKERITKALTKKPKLHVVSFSGGKDSTAMLLRMIEEKMPIDIILFCDTGLEFPEMEEHVNKVEEYIGRPITRLKAEKDFMYWATEHKHVIKTDKAPNLKPGDTAIGYGYPTLRARWCTKNLKTEVINSYLKSLRDDYEIIEYVGIAVDEQERVKDKVYPLVMWKMTETDCLKYCYDRGFTWGGLYEIWDRVSCWCCPLQSLNDLRKLKKNRPHLWLKLKILDYKMGFTRRPNFKFKVSLTDLERRFEVEEEFLAQGKKLRTKEFFQALKDRGIKY